MGTESPSECSFSGATLTCLGESLTPDQTPGSYRRQRSQPASEAGSYRRQRSEPGSEDFRSIDSRSRSSSCSSRAPPPAEEPHPALELPVEAVSQQSEVVASSTTSHREEPAEAKAEVAAPSKEKEVSSETDEDVSREEKELTKQVPSLLESMNRASNDVNTLERQASDAEDRYRQLLEQLSRLHEELRARYGPAMEIARPYFEAVQALDVTSRFAQGIARDFSSASAQHTQAKADLRAIEDRLFQGSGQVTLDAEHQDGLSRATVRVMVTQQARDKLEREHARVLREYQEAQEAVELWKVEVGDAMIRRTWPCFRQLQQHQAELQAAQNRISALVERAQASKHSYRSSLRELDRINMSVHSVRQVPSKGSPKAAISVSASQDKRSQVTPAPTKYGLSVVSQSDGPESDSSPAVEKQPLLTSAMLSSDGGITPGFSRDGFGRQESEAFAFGTPEEAIIAHSYAKGVAQDDTGPLDDGPFA